MSEQRKPCKRGCVHTDETCLLKKKKSAPLSFISNMVRSFPLSYASWATLRKEICGVGSAHGKQVAEQKNPFVISPVTQICKNRLPLNIILTTTAAWRLPVRPIRMRPLNQKSNVRLSWSSVHDEYQPVRSPDVLGSAVRY